MNGSGAYVACRAIFPPHKNPPPGPPSVPRRCALPVGHDGDHCADRHPERLSVTWDAASAEPEPHRNVFARITKVTFTPEDDSEWPRPITVEWRGAENHCVKQGSQVWNDVEGVWEYEPPPSSRDAAFISLTRYPYEKASALAVRLLAQQLNPKAPNRDSGATS